MTSDSSLRFEEPELRRQRSHQNPLNGDFPGGAVVKNPPANAGDTGLSPGPERSHMPQSN